MNNLLSRSVVLALTLGLSACSSAPATREKASSTAVITFNEIREAGYPDLFAAVQSLRPSWLRQRGQTSLRQRDFVKVYLDGALLGGVDFLRQITSSSVAEVRYMTGIEASNRYGLDHGMGAILVFTRRE
jgi:hypothetical protein